MTEVGAAALSRTKAAISPILEGNGSRSGKKKIPRRRKRLVLATTTTTTPSLTAESCAQKEVQVEPVAKPLCAVTATAAALPNKPASRRAGAKKKKKAKKQLPQKAAVVGGGEEDIGVAVHDATAATTGLEMNTQLQLNDSPPVSTPTGTAAVCAVDNAVAPPQTEESVKPIAVKQEPQDPVTSPAPDFLPLESPKATAAAKPKTILGNKNSLAGRKRPPQSQVENPHAAAANRAAIEEHRKNLPIFKERSKLTSILRNEKALVIVGDTGSGKTTQLPQYLFEDDLLQGKMIGITQPRRVAAITIAQRVAEEMGTHVGGLVGYTVRFEDVTSPATKLKFLTDGMLLREAMLDPMLNNYSIIILDEAHERTVHTDILFGLIKHILETRSDMKVVVMSATLDPTLFATYFSAKIHYIPGRQYPVELFYTPEAEPDYLDAVLITVLQIHLEEPPGDILVFLTGKEEIEATEKLLEEKAEKLPPDSMRMMICPIFAALASEHQMRVFEPTLPGVRKVVLATNIAETSITISGIKYVVDTGVVKARAWNTRVGIETLAVIAVSKAQAKQRCGRAGRQAPGKCFRLYTEGTYLDFKDNTTPEIKRCNLATVILQMLVVGIKNVVKFDYLDKPPLDSLRRAFAELHSLDAVNSEMELTDTGKHMSRFPVDPKFAKVLLASQTYKCSKEVLTIISMLTVETVFAIGTGKEQKLRADAARKRFLSMDGDHFVALSIYKEWSRSPKKLLWANDNCINFKSMRHVEQVREQLEEYMTAAKMDVNLTCGTEDTSAIRKCFITGFFQQTALAQPNKTYLTILSNKVVSIHPSSVMHAFNPPCVLYNDLVWTQKPYMLQIMQIDEAWLPEVAPKSFSKKRIFVHQMRKQITG
ncbi:pre-mRNA-splicing factor ATP-dependent RNA helicase DEAH10 [Pelomyxa schiedti]|nr:pre-mRNA-splicing factor ATP-dependent RNA helicase DEAH10 [Pelomyxa schiedti]